MLGGLSFSSFLYPSLSAPQLTTVFHKRTSVIQAISSLRLILCLLSPVLSPIPPLFCSPGPPLASAPRPIFAPFFLLPPIPSLLLFLPHPSDHQPISPPPALSCLQVSSLFPHPPLCPSVLFAYPSIPIPSVPLLCSVVTPTHAPPTVCFSPLLAPYHLHSVSLHPLTLMPLLSCRPLRPAVCGQDREESGGVSAGVRALRQPPQTQHSALLAQAADEGD